MTEILPALIQRDSDFFQYGGDWIDGACPATALANAASTSLGRRITPLSVYELMLAHGLCSANGAATMYGIKQAALLLGCEIASTPDAANGAGTGWMGNGWSGWQAWMYAQISAGNQCIMETAYSQALKDGVTGEGENYLNSLLYHFWSGIGWLTGGTSAYAEKTFNKIVTGPGVWSVDGDNWAFDNGIEWDFNCGDFPQFYDLSVIAAAKPCAGLAIVGKAQPVWTKESDGTGKDSAGHVCSAGFMSNLEANPSDLASDGLANSTALSNGTAFLPLENGTLFLADPVSAPFKRLALPGLAQEYMKLYELLVAAENKPAPVPAPAPIPAEYVAALAAVKALQAAQAAISAAAPAAAVTVPGGSLNVTGSMPNFVVTNA
jgi:hypothetical protein